jgi:hypothetical protein
MASCQMENHAGFCLTTNDCPIFVIIGGTQAILLVIIKLLLMMMMI